MATVKINNDYGSYICKYGQLHDYSKIKPAELEKDINEKKYNNVKELIEDIEGERKNKI